MAEVPNLKYIKEIAGGNNEFEKKFIAIIQAEFPQEKEDYLRHLENGAWEESAKVVHKMKHKFGILGLTDGYKTAIKYEEDLKKGKTTLMDEFSGILDTVEDFIIKIS